VNNVVLIGFMGTGKTSVGRVLAQHIRRPFLDLDDLIEQEAGRPIAEIFEMEGERGFRARESSALTRLLATDSQVVAVGGGAPLAADNWQRIRDRNVVVALAASAETLRARLGDGAGRPMLADGVDAALATLLPQRMRRYQQADLVIDVDRFDPASVAIGIKEALPNGGVYRIPVDVPDAEHEISLGYRLAACLGPALRRAGVHGKVLVVTDDQVGSEHAPLLEAALSHAGFDPYHHVLPQGERAKSVEPLMGLYEFLAASGVDRHGGLVSLGGGTVGDVTGFAAATWLRGVPYVQVPTTLLAMVDSSIGGKTAINLAAGKNLVGAVYQPAAILTDLSYLDTLPAGEFRSGWAEIIKTAIIGDASLFERLRAERPALMARDAQLFPEVVASTCAFKAQVVAEDPHETGRRAILNYGHTVGHALEAAAGYGVLTHGDAIAWGMKVAGRLSLRLGLANAETVAAQDRVLTDYGLLGSVPEVSRARLLAALRHDKKAKDGEPRWVLLRELGRVEYGCQVPAAAVETILDEVLAR
jgi:shikimate kinase / 3-dehydroquinate synthase